MESGLKLTCDGGRKWGEDKDKEKEKGKGRGRQAGRQAEVCKQKKIKVT